MTKAELLTELATVSDDAVITVCSLDGCVNDIAVVLSAKASPDFLKRDEVYLHPTDGRIDV